MKYGCVVGDAPKILMKLLAPAGGATVTPFVRDTLTPTQVELSILNGEEGSLRNVEPSG